MLIHPSLDRPTVEFLFGDRSPYGNVLSAHPLDLQRTSLELRYGGSGSGLGEVYRLVFAADVRAANRRVFFVAFADRFTGPTVRVGVGEEPARYRDARRVGEVRVAKPAGTRPSWPGIVRAGMGAAAPLLLERLTDRGSKEGS